MRLFSITVILATVLASCTSTNQEKAKEEARQDAHKAADDAKRAGHEIKEEAKELTRRVDASVQPDTQSASEKLSDAEARAKTAASHAGVKLDHATLLASVKTKLAADAGLSTLTNVNVDVRGSVVTLSGTVASESQKQTAETAAARVDGVTQVKNLLTVQP